MYQIRPNWERLRHKSCNIALSGHSTGCSQWLNSGGMPYPPATTQPLVDPQSNYHKHGCSHTNTGLHTITCTAVHTQARRFTHKHGVSHTHARLFSHRHGVSHTGTAFHAHAWRYLCCNNSIQSSKIHFSFIIFTPHGTTGNINGVSRISTAVSRNFHG